MPAKKSAAVAVFLMFFWIPACLPAWGGEGRPVMYLSVSLLPENNIIKVSWESQGGVAGYNVERWEIEGTNHWHFNINQTVKTGDKKLIMGGLELYPLVFVHKAGPGEDVVLYDQNVRPGHTYFYRVNGGIIGVIETRKKPVVPLDGQTLVAVKERQAGEYKDSAGERGEKAGGGMAQRQKQYEGLTDYPERMAADLIMALPNWLIKVVGLYDPLELVFGVELKDSFKIEDDSSARKSGLVWETFSKKEFRVVGDFYAGAMQAMPVFMAAGVAVAGLLVLFNAASSRALLTAREYILGILICALLVKLGPYLLGFFFDVNRAVVALCHGVVAGEIQQSFLHTVYSQETRSLGAALLALIGCISIGVINFQFALRKVFIAILVGVLPIALINAIFPGRRQALAVWVREFASYVFMPAGLAVGLAFFIHFLNAGEFWVTLACLIILPAINGMVRGALGVAAGVGSALGVGALFSLGGILTGGKDEKGEGARGLSAVVGGGPDGGPGPVLGSKAPGLGSLAGGVLKGVSNAAVAGSVALAGGMVSGAATGDPGPGLEYGAKTGRGAMSFFNGAGRNLGDFFSDVRGKGFAGATGIVDGSMLMDPGVSASLAVRALGDNAAGSAAAAFAATAARTARAASVLLAPEARERLDMVTATVAGPSQDGFKQPQSSEQSANLAREFEKARQAQHFKNMFERIKNSQHTGGSGGIYHSPWR